MCGIISITGKNINDFSDENIKGMILSLSKRGPDDNGVLKFPECILGQTRLSIIDINMGHQPMRDNEKDLAITFNGEIYNYRELKKELEKIGHVFSTNSDTEVILKAYVEYGNDCPQHLDGMFSFSIWNNEKKELFIARDRFGKKPFYYAWVNDTFLGASEIKAIFASNLIKGIIDKKTLDNYLQLSYIPPWKTIYSNIHTLLPAHAGVVKNGEIKTWQYWKLEDKPIEITYENAKEKLKVLFNDAVKKRMVADVEIGSFLSGGVDSTIATAYAQKYTSTPIKTFSVGYEGYINELPFAKQASEKIGTKHYTLQTKSELILKEINKVMEYLDEPHADSSNISQHLISELTSSNVKVAISGDGADELLMGYGWYWKYWNTNKLIYLKNVLFSNQFKEYLKHVAIFSKKERINLWKNHSFLNEDIEKHNEKTNVNKIKAINNFDIETYLPGQLLVKIDRMSMMHGLEVRSPFLDHKMAEFIYNLPEKYKVNKKGGKIILKDILTEIMPKEFVYRRKQGFGAPVKEWLQIESFKQIVKNTINENQQLNELFNKKELLNILNNSNKDESSNPYKIWSLFCLALWFKHHQKYHE